MTHVDVIQKYRKTDFPVTSDEFGLNLWDFVETLPGTNYQKYVVVLYMPSGDILLYGAWFCHSFNQALDAVCDYHGCFGAEFGEAQFEIQGHCHDEPCHCGGFHMHHGSIVLSSEEKAAAADRAKEEPEELREKTD